MDKLTKFKISATLKNKVTKSPPLYAGSRLPKPVSKFSVDGEFIEEFPSIKKAAERENVSRRSIQDNINGRSKTCNGCVFKLKQNP